MGLFFSHLKFVHSKTSVQSLTPYTKVFGPPWRIKSFTNPLLLVLVKLFIPIQNVGVLLEVFLIMLLRSCYLYFGVLPQPETGTSVSRSLPTVRPEVCGPFRPRTQNETKKNLLLFHGGFPLSGICCGCYRWILQNPMATQPLCTSFLFPRNSLTSHELKRPSTTKIYTQGKCRRLRCFLLGVC